MSRLKELRQAKAEKVKELGAYLDSIPASQALTEDQKAKANGLQAEIEGLNERLVVAEALNEEERTLAGFQDNNAAVEQQRQEKTDGTKFASFGEQMAAVAQAEINKGARGAADERLVYNTFTAASGLSEGAAADGGYLVQTDFASELLKRAYELGILASRVRRVPIGPQSNGLKVNAVSESSRANGSRFGGVQAYWTGEADQLTASKPKFRQMELSLKKLTGLAYATDELLMDTTALGSVLQQAFEEEFAFKLDDAIMRGTGAGMPKGYLDAACTITVGEAYPDGGTAIQGADTVVVENIVDMWARCWARSRQNAVWLINQSIEPQLMKLRIGDVPIYLPAGGLSGAPYATLLGRPVIPIEHASALGDKGDIQLVDLSQYLLIDKGGIQSAQSMHVRFLYDEMTFRFIYRADGQPIWDNPLTPYKGNDTLSPFVVLGERDGAT